MTRIDFYISPQKEPAALQLLACKLTEKAYKLGHRVYLHVATTEQAQHLDDLLWTFRDGSFIPHEKIGTESTKPAPVLIGHDQEIAHEADILINLAAEIPDFFSRFERVAELVNDDPEQKELARQRYKFYRDRGYELKTHNL